MLMTGQKDNSVTVLQMPCVFEKQTCKVLQSTWFRNAHNSSFLYCIILVLYRLCCKEFTLPYMAQVALNASWSFASFAQQESGVWCHDDMFLRNIALSASVRFWSVPWRAALASEASHSPPSSRRTQSLQLERARWAGGRPRAKRWRNRVFQAHLRWFGAKISLANTIYIEIDVACCCVSRFLTIIT